MLSDIYLKYNKKIFYGNHKAIKISQLQIGASMGFLVEVKFMGKCEKPRPNIYFKTKNVILATGA